MPRRCSRCSRIRKSATRRDCPRTRSPTSCASGCPRIQGAFIIVIPPPAVPGIGTGGGFAMRVQDRQGRGPEMLAAATDELVAAARKAPGLTQVFSPFTANTPQVFVEIDRVKAQKLGVPIAERHRYDPDLFRLVLCQRLQHVRPHLPRHRAGRPAVPQGDLRSGAAAHPQRRRRHGAARQRREFPRHRPGPTASRATIFIPPPNCRATRCRAPVRRPRSTP